MYGHLGLPDFLRLRRTCKSLYSLVCEVDIAEVMRTLVREYGAAGITPSLTEGQADSSFATVDQLLALSHLVSVARAIGRFLATFHLMETYSYSSAAELARSQHAPNVEILTENLMPYLMIISNMLTVYRASVAKIVQTADREPRSVEKLRMQGHRAEHDIMKQYDSGLIAIVSIVFDLLKKTLFRQLRPASYASFLERQIRGWTKPSAKDDEVMSLIVFGGLGAIEQIISVPTYNLRIQTLESWLSTLGISQPPQAKKNQAARQPSMDHGLGLATIKRIQTMLPNRSDFLNVVALAEFISPQEWQLRRRSAPRPDPTVVMMCMRSERPDIRPWDLKMRSI